MIEKLLKKGILLCVFFLITASMQGMICKAETTLKAPNPVRVWRQSDTSLYLKWSKVKNADGYIIYKYDKTRGKYIKYKTIKNNSALIFNDEIGSRTSAKYKISAFKQAGKKKVIGQQSYPASARTYKQGDRKVNAGKVKVRAAGESYCKDYSVDLAYYETLKLSAKVKPDTYSKAKGKSVLSKKVRWYSSNTKIATVDKNGCVKAQAKAGRCHIYTRAHNGKKSNKILIFVENYARPKKSTLNLGAAWADPERYGPVLEMFENNYKTVTDIAEYFYINRPAGNETFKCWMEKGEVKMSPENYVSGKMKQTIYNFIKNFSYDIRLDVSSDIVKFTELYGLSEEYRYAGTKVVFKYDQNKRDPNSYTTEYQMATNWVYGSFAGI